MDNSPLSRLSPELRNKIYELVLLGTREVRIDVADPANQVHHPLTQTCRQIYTEAKYIDYAHTDVIFDSYGSGRLGDSKHLAEWLRIMGADACKALHSIDHHFISTHHYQKLVAVEQHAADHVEYLPSTVCVRDYVWTSRKQTIARTLEAMSMRLDNVKFSGLFIVDYDGIVMVQE